MTDAPTYAPGRPASAGAPTGGASNGGRVIRRRRRLPGGRAVVGAFLVATAIAVLIMAFLGAAMWVAFNAVFQDASGKISSQVGQIGG